jgi:molybdopterin molybdotransferase
LIHRSTCQYWWLDSTIGVADSFFSAVSDVDDTMHTNHGDLLWRDEAVAAVLDRRESVLDGRGTESVSMDEVAGRTLAVDVVATADSPPFDYATMDGYALDAAGEYPYELADEETFPEDDPPVVDADEAAPIATGAPLPEGTNAVLKREEASVENGRLHGPPIEAGTYTYEQGSNVTAGEQLFSAGERLSPKDAILLRDLGHETVAMRKPFSVGVLATGTEIAEGRSTDLDSAMLHGLVESWGHQSTYEGTVPDEYDRVEARIEKLAARYDVVLTTGGTSVGKKDYVVRALEKLGEVGFHGVRVRPGKPIVVATLPDAVVVGIPGKPLGAHTVTTLVARPFFTGNSALPTVQRRFSHDLSMGPDGFEYAVPVTVSDTEATPLGHVDSPLPVYDSTFDPSVLSSSTRASRADGVVLTTDDLVAGEDVAVVPHQVVA